MRYKAYDKNNNVVETAAVINKSALRLAILTSDNLHVIESVEYNQKKYNISDIYKI